MLPLLHSINVTCPCRSEPPTRPDTTNPALEYPSLKPLLDLASRLERNCWGSPPGWLPSSAGSHQPVYSASRVRAWSIHATPSTNRG
jgi:hypothetical protein